MKRLICIGLLLIFAPTVWAQEPVGAKTTGKLSPEATKEAPLPATAVIPPAIVKEIVGLQKDAEIINLRVSNLQLQIDKAQTELAKLRDDAKKAADALNQASIAAAKAAGIQSDKLAEYDITPAPDGAWILKKKDKPAALPGN